VIVRCAVAGRLCRCPTCGPSRKTGRFHFFRGPTPRNARQAGSWALVECGTCRNKVLTILNFDHQFIILTNFIII
jgi:hypothetical protein